jgi:hypothetical protein
MEMLSFSAFPEEEKILMTRKSFACEGRRGRA